MLGGQLGDDSLPLEQPEMFDDDFLRKLHHVLLEVRLPGSTLKSHRADLHVERVII